MAHDVHRPHDKLFRTVFADQRQAAALLQAHLPESIAGHLRWSSLALQDRTFVDDDLLDSESDLLFSIKRTAGHPPAWLYVLLEHQSRPDRWMPFRLLKYCCLIWERARQQYPNERRLRPIVPLVFYQGRRRWRHPTEFAELFGAPVRDWPWVPQFAHLLIDQSQVGPQAVRGRLQGRIAQLMMMARYRHRREALQHAARLLAQMLTGGGGEAVRPLVRYLLATQTCNTARRYRVAGDRGGYRHRPGRPACPQAAACWIGRGKRPPADVSAVLSRRLAPDVSEPRGASASPSGEDGRRGRPPPAGRSARTPARYRARACQPDGQLRTDRRSAVDDPVDHLHVAAGGGRQAGVG